MLDYRCSCISYDSCVLTCIEVLEGVTRQSSWQAEKPIKNVLIRMCSSPWLGKTIFLTSLTLRGCQSVSQHFQVSIARVCAMWLQTLMEVISLKGNQKSTQHMFLQSRTTAGTYVDTLLSTQTHVCIKHRIQYGFLEETLTTSTRS